MHLTNRKKTLASWRLRTEQEVEPYARLPEVADDIIALGGAGILTRRNVTGLDVNALVLQDDFCSYFKVYGLSEDVTLVHLEFLPLTCKNTHKLDYSELKR